MGCCLLSISPLAYVELIIHMHFSFFDAAVSLFHPHGYHFSHHTDLRVRNRLKLFFPPAILAAASIRLDVASLGHLKLPR